MGDRNELHLREVTRAIKGHPGQETPREWQTNRLTRPSHIIYNVRSEEYNITGNSEDSIHRRGIVVEGSLNLYLHKVTSFFVHLFVLDDIVVNLSNNIFE